MAADSKMIKDYFKAIDSNNDGIISGAELIAFLRNLDCTRWSDEAANQLLMLADTNEDGLLQLTEFWNWVDSPAGKANAIPWAEATAEAKAKQQALLVDRREAARNAAEKEASAELVARAAKDKKTFIDERVAVGVSEKVATHIYDVADQDGDGAVDDQELRSFNRYEAGTKDQVKGIFKMGVKPGDPEASPGSVDEKAVEELLRAFACWDADGDGVVTCDEVARVFQVLNPKMPQESIDAVIAEADENQDGYVDVFEFADWLCAQQPDAKKKKQMKKIKKEKEDREATLCIGLNRQRYEEARKAGKQKEFEAAQHDALQEWCATNKKKTTCSTLNSGPLQDDKCSSCGGRHAWMCHQCGYVSYYDSCMNGCPWGGQYGDTGWSCMGGKCKKGCGCKKPAAFWKRKGCVTGSLLRKTAPP